jgi:malate:Na+ symporter
MGEAAKISVDSPAQPAHGSFWPQGWWRILDFKIGIVPLPVYLVLVALIVAFIQISNGKIASDLLTSTPS